MITSSCSNDRVSCRVSPNIEEGAAAGRGRNLFSPPYFDVSPVHTLDVSHPSDRARAIVPILIFLK